MPPDNIAELEHRITELERQVLWLSTGRRGVVRVVWGVVAGLLLLLFGGGAVWLSAMHSSQVMQLQGRIEQLEGRVMGRP